MKRISNTELNHDNWNDEEAPQDRGKFETAASEVISKRKVITARRKPSTSQAGIFKAFTGFSTNPISTSSATKNDNKEKHLNSLKMLNKKFLENIEKCIDENSCCILSPLFDDYQRHLTTIKTKFPLNNPSVITSSSFILPKPEITNSSNNDVVDKPSTKTLFNFNQSASAYLPETTKDIEKPLFTFGGSNAKPQEIILFGAAIEVSKPTEASLFNAITSNNATFAQSTVDIQSTPFNLFGTTPPNMFGATAPNMFSANLSNPGVAPTSNANDDDEEYVPPKAEVREVKESDSVYDIRCKLFYQVDQIWKDKGVGTIFIKPLTPGKFQLVMRADNSLGTILLNVLITKTMPLSVNKNNVSLVAMTDLASSDAKLTPLLIRVKTGDNAEELLTAMKKQLNE